MFEGFRFERVGSGELDGGRITDMGTRSFTQVHVPSTEDHYILLPISTTYNLYLYYL
jgi:hypothetical protein